MLDDREVQSALGFVAGVTAPARAVSSGVAEVGERGEQAVRSDVPKAERADPGVSTIQPPAGSRRAIADTDVCRPRPVTVFTPPVSR
jgi:hypothetical protein